MNGISISYLFNTWRLNAIQCTFTWTPFHLCLYWNEIFCWSNTFRIDSIWLVYKYHHISWFQWKCHVGNMLLSYSNFFFRLLFHFFNRFFPWKIPSSVNLVSIYVRTKLQMKYSKFRKVFCGFRFWANCVLFFHVRQYNFILERKPQPLHAPCLRCHHYRFTFCVHTNCMEVSHISKAHILHFIYLHIL